MHHKRVVLGLAAAALASAGCSSFPNAPGLDDAADPPAYVNVIQTEEMQIQLVPQNAAGAPRNDHPAAFRPEQLDALLTSLRVNTENQASAGTLTSPSRLDAFSKGLSKAFARANPGQDIAFVIFRRGGGGFFSGTSRYVTSGRAFYRGDTLNLIFGEFDAPFSEFRDTSINGFDHGSRTRETDVEGQRLVSNGTWQWHDGRHDWIEMTATPEAIDAAATAAPQVIESNASSAARPMSYGPAAAGAEAVAPASKSSASMPAESISTPTGRAAPAATDGWSRIEERLSQLKRLRDKNLISADDYQQKKDALLEQLP